MPEKPVRAEGDCIDGRVVGQHGEYDGEYDLGVARRVAARR
jgi:hypothetical protein